ncbi:hypothetical protein [Streptomyces zagrosensis]|uniref:Uncharacterized protein n=1 Tax=Streptomyces zagrosensis TaxID=1042984 RepID=A0A7W9Q6Z7_9ACTN|nr:hypothetical protein [Streptomyces zagrosensis]MBB5934318.1 hypothetical protein [Streptomyces zagrosensis]
MSDTPAPEPADAKLAALIDRHDQEPRDDADSWPTAAPCATCRAVIITRDRAHTLRDWPQYREAVETLHAHRRAEHQKAGAERAEAERRALVLTGHHTVHTANGPVLRFFLAGADLSGTAWGWVPVTDAVFQHAYEEALFDPRASEPGEVRSNVYRVQLPLDALAGHGGFFWSDGAQVAGVMTTNGKAPEQCGLGPAGPRDDTREAADAPHVRVRLMVWRPLTPDDPGDVSGGMPQVLLTRDDTNPWQVPGVILRPGELLVSAAERIASALGLELPRNHRVLATDFRRPERMTLVVDGGWVAGRDERLAAGELSPCTCHAAPHHRRWAPSEDLDDVMRRALRAAVSLPPVKETRR